MRRSLLGGLAALVAVLTLAIVPGPARPAGAATGPHIDVLTQTPWVQPDGTFLLTAKITDAPTGARVEATLHTEALADRNAFARSLFGVDLGDKTLKIPSVVLANVPEDDDGGRRINIAIALKQRLPGPSSPGQTGVPRGLAGEGAYPVELKLFDADDRELTKIVTHLVRLPDDDEETEPLRAAVVLGIHAPPTVGPRGADAATPATFRSANVIANVLHANPDVPLTIDPTPETIEALNRSSTASRRTLERLRTSLDGRQVLDGPYVDLPITSWINDGLGNEPLDQERARGNRILAKLLTPAPDGSTWVAAPDLTTGSAAALWKQGVRHLVVRPDALAPATGVIAEATLARPFQIDSSADAPLSAVAVDTSFQAAFDRRDDPELTAYQVLAELSVIQEEAPDSARGIVLAAPPDWNASTAFLSTLLDGLARDPLVEPVTIDDLFRQVSPLQAGPNGDGAAVVRRLAPLPPTDLGSYPQDLASVRSRIASYSTMIDPDDPLLAQWDQRLLISGSADLTRTERSAYLRVIDSFITRQRDAIDAPARQTVTLTAKDGRIPLTLRSNLQTPVKVVLELRSSSRLEFPPGGDHIAVTLKPGAAQIPLQVRTRSPGDTPLIVRVVSPDGGLDLTGTQITVRSTAVSGIGYVLSVGAVLFLIIWWARHWRRALRDRRRDRSEVPA